MRVEKGNEEVIGYWSRSGKSRSYRSFCSFKPVATPTYIDRIDFSNIFFDFVMSVTLNGTGCIKAPAFRLLDPEFQDTLFIIIDPRTLKFEEKQLNIRVTSESAAAEAIEFKELYTGL